MNSTDAPAPAQPANSGPGPSSPRLASLDTFRGATMLLMASGGLGIPQIAKSFPDSSAWNFLGRQFDHAAWAGCTLWDLIQPAFMFLVGVALPWSVANRRDRGQTTGTMFGHALGRSISLVLLAVFLTSAWSRQTDWIFPNVLAQIGLGYPFLFLLALARPRTQWLAAGGILSACWIAFTLYPLPPPAFDWPAAGVPEDWPHLRGLAAHWEKNANLAAAFDRWFLNLFPRAVPFIYNAGGYQTLNFIPSLATMIFGLLAGQWLRSDHATCAKVKRLALLGGTGIALGQSMDFGGLCPIVKRLWTPSWALFSSGLVALLLASFVVLGEGRAWKRWTFPLVIAGLNPLTLYCLWQLTGGFIRDSLKTHAGEHVFEIAGTTCALTVERASVLMVFWLILLGMYRRKLFLRF